MRLVNDCNQEVIVEDEGWPTSASIFDGILLVGEDQKLGGEGIEGRVMHNAFIDKGNTTESSKSVCWRIGNTHVHV